MSVTRIENSAFENCGNLTDIYYEGSKADWKQIKIDNFLGGNNKLVGLFGKVNIHYNCK